MIRGIEIMSIKVKRKLWFLSAMMPVIIKFNGKTVGTLYGSQEIEIPMDGSEGELKYYQPIGRNDQLEVNSGDVIHVEETLLGKIFSILFVVLMLYFVTKIVGLINFTAFSNYEELMMIERVIFGILLVAALIALFFKTNRLKKVN